MTCPVSHLLGSECRDDPLLQERAQAPVDVSALTSNAPVPFRMPWSHRRHTVPQEVRRAFDPGEIAPLQGKPRFRSPSTPGRITSYENPSNRLRFHEARGSHVVVDELEKRANQLVLLMRRAPENSASSTVISIASVVCLSALARASPYRFPSLCAAYLIVAAVRRHGFVLLRSMVLRGKRSELEKPPSALNLRIRVCPYRNTAQLYRRLIAMALQSGVAIYSTFLVRHLTATEGRHAYNQSSVRRKALPSRIESAIQLFSGRGVRGRSSYHQSSLSRSWLTSRHSTALHTGAPTCEECRQNQSLCFTP